MQKDQEILTDLPPVRTDTLEKSRNVIRLIQWNLRKHGISGELQRHGVSKQNVGETLDYVKWLEEHTKEMEFRINTRTKRADHIAHPFHFQSRHAEDITQVANQKNKPLSVIDGLDGLVNLEHNRWQGINETVKIFADIPDLEPITAKLKQISHTKPIEQYFIKKDPKSGNLLYDTGRVGNSIHRREPISFLSSLAPELRAAYL